MSWSPATKNVQERERAFLQGCIHFHNSFCGCNDLINHLLRISNYTGSEQNPGSTPKPQPPLIRRALPAPAAPDQTWLGGGGGEEGGPGRTGGEGGGQYAPEDLEDLFAAVAGDVE